MTERLSTGCELTLVVGHGVTLTRCMSNSRSRNFRRRNRPRTNNRPAQLRATSTKRETLGPYAEAIMEANACEAAGDARGALDVIERTPHGPDGTLMWSPWRVDRLLHVVAWEKLLPAWAYGRWMVQQSSSQLTRSSVKRTMRATDMAIAVQGRSPAAETSRQRTWIGDHDWVAHQLAVHDLGGLEEFVSGRPAVAQLADDIDSWVGVPMGGYRYLHGNHDELVWEDLADGNQVTTINLGAIEAWGAGRGVLGRVVRSGDVRLFDIAPAPVSLEVARAVAAEPDTWLDVVTASEDARTLGLLGPGQDGALLTDLTENAWRDALLDPAGHGDVGRGRLEIDPTPAEEDSRVADAILDLLRRPLDDGLTPWPCVAAALLWCGVHETLLSRLRPEYASQLLALAPRLAGPAADLCRVTGEWLRDCA